MKSFVLKIWKKIVTFLTWLWNKVKSWFLKTALVWLKKSWLQIVNVLVVLYAYGKLDDATSYSSTFPTGPAAIVGLWAFVLLVYWVFWKFFGAEKILKKKK